MDCKKTPLFSGSALRFSLILLLLIISHLVVPPVAYANSARDSDVGLWLCGGIVISELMMLGLIYAWRFGQPQWRLIFAASLNVLIVLVAFTAASLYSAMSKEDAVTLLFLLFGVSIYFSVLDAYVSRYFRLCLASSEHKSIHCGRFDCDLGNRRDSTHRRMEERRYATLPELGVLDDRGRVCSGPSFDWNHYPVAWLGASYRGCEHGYQKRSNCVTLVFKGERRQFLRNSF